MNYTRLLIDMVGAYKKDLGDAFPSADPRSVLQILLLCTERDSVSQKEIEDATGLAQPNIAKLVAVMVREGWLMQLDREPNSNVKRLQISPFGLGVLNDLEKACREATGKLPKSRNAKEGCK